MRLIVNLRLKPTSEQYSLLLATLERTNDACNDISATAWEQRAFGQYALQKLVYADVKARFGLTAQVVVRSVAKVADAYKLDRKAKRIFRRRGSIAYDDRILRFKADDAVSIWTLTGRQVIAFVCGEKQRQLLAHRKGETDLVYRSGDFYLNVVCDVEEPALLETGDVLGVDMGIVNILADSDGQTYSGAHLNGLRRRHARVRSRLQSVGTPSAKRLLQKRRRRERNFARDVNHTISKAVVGKAQRTCRAIALEDLHGIRDRVTARKPQRRQLHSWAFNQLRQFIQYKARLAGVPTLPVDPRNTSRTCPNCGCVDKRNRPNQSTFSCIQCGLSGPADTIAAENIRRAAVIRPNVGATVRPTSPPL